MQARRGALGTTAGKQARAAEGGVDEESLDSSHTPGLNERGKPKCAAADVSNTNRGSGRSREPGWKGPAEVLTLVGDGGGVI